MSVRLTKQPDRKHILLVEPNHEVFVRLMILIDEAAGDEYALDWAASYRFGTSLLKRNPYQACLVGSQIGLHSGREFVAAAQRLKPNVPIIMLDPPPGGEDDLELRDEHLWDRLQLDQLDGQLLFNTLREAASQRASD